MGMYKYLREAWKKPKENPFWKERLIELRQEPISVRLERPTRLDRARSLGYRAKPGVIVVRQQIGKSRRMRPFTRRGRRPKAFRHKKVTKMNFQFIAEQRVSRKYPNCEVMNSYFLAEDGKHVWYEVILLDKEHPQVKADKTFQSIIAKKGRALRGLTSAARRSRGLRNKGKGAEKVRPSLKARKGLAK